MSSENMDQIDEKNELSIKPTTTTITAGEISVYRSPESDNTDTPDEDAFDDVDKKAVMRKIDYHLLPIAAILYLLAYLDRGNIGNAKIEGLPESLSLSTTQYNLCLTIFFITYSLFEIPANMLLKKLGKQSIFLPGIMLGWGIIMTLMGTVKNFAGLFVTRLLLGVLEAGLYPGISFGLTMYYTKNEMQQKQAFFYSAASLAGAFSGLLAFAIAKMDGVGGYEGWRWIFILEGLLTVIFSFLTFVFKWLPDYPNTAKFLTEREKEYVAWRLKSDVNSISKKSMMDVETVKQPNFMNFDEEHDITLKESLKNVFTDWQCYLHVLLILGIVTPTYGISLFLPSVINALGYTSSKAQLLTIPIYICASILSVVQAFICDKIGIRSIFMMINLTFISIGFIMAIIGQELVIPGLIYGGVFVAVINLYPGFPTLISWHSNNLANSKKRAIGMAFQIGWGNMGGAFASNFYKPGHYTMGHGLELGFTVLGMVATIILVIGYNRINKKRKTMLEKAIPEEMDELELFKLGDKSPYYRYRL